MAVTQLEMLVEEERHARMRLEAERAHLAHIAAEDRNDHESLIEELEQQWMDALDRLRHAHGHES